MTHPQVVILGYSEAAMFLRGERGPEVRGLVSIHGAREFGVESNVPHRLDLRFDDVDAANPGDLASVQAEITRRRWASENGLRPPLPPKADDVAALIDFARRIRGTDGLVLVHCAAGMSRAPAAALVMLAAWTGPGREAECVAEVRRLRPGATPLPTLVRLADERLRRRGNLLRASLAPTD